MKLFSSIILLLGLTLFSGLSTDRVAAEETSGILYDSPKGSYRIQVVEGKDRPLIVSIRLLQSSIKPLQRAQPK